MKTDKKRITIEKVFHASCSNCGTAFEGDGDYIPFFMDKESLKESLLDYEWSTSLNDRGNIAKDNIYCSGLFYD